VLKFRLMIVVKMSFTLLNDYYCTVNDAILMQTQSIKLIEQTALIQQGAESIL